VERREQIAQLVAAAWRSCRAAALTVEARVDEREGP
jgi:hypothetical protein